MRTSASSTRRGLPRRLQGLAQDDIVEGAGGIGVEIGVGVALDDRQAMADAGIDPGLANSMPRPSTALWRAR